MFARNSNSVSRCCDPPDPLSPPPPPQHEGRWGMGGGGGRRGQLGHSLRIHMFYFNVGI